MHHGAYTTYIVMCLPLCPTERLAQNKIRRKLADGFSFIYLFLLSEGQSFTVSTVPFWEKRQNGACGPKKCPIHLKTQPLDSNQLELSIACNLTFTECCKILPQNPGAVLSWYPTQYLQCCSDRKKQRYGVNAGGSLYLPGGARSEACPCG